MLDGYSNATHILIPNPMLLFCLLLTVLPNQISAPYPSVTKTRIKNNICFFQIHFAAGGREWRGSRIQRQLQGR